MANQESPKDYLSVNLIKEGARTIRISVSKPYTIEEFDPWNISKKKRDEIDEKLRRIKLFLRSPIETNIEELGLAIGIQNCIYFEKDLYIGLRKKAKVDDVRYKNTGVSIALGSFNTGYKLIKGEKDINLNSLQDLFDAIPEKQFIDENDKVFEMLKKKLDNEVWEISFGKDTKRYQGTIFLNDSEYMPRLEIGIWKFIALDPQNIVNGFYEGFGADKYSGEGNYWIWVKHGKIYFESFESDEDVKERLKVINRSSDSATLNKIKGKHRILLTRKFLDEIGIKEKYTPFASDEALASDCVINLPFSSPARALLSRF